MTHVETAWLAGLLEGEGSFCVNRQHRVLADDTPRTYLYPQISLAMTDEDVIERALAVAGAGRVSGPFVRKIDDSKNGRKPYWVWQSSKREETREIMRAVLPFMGERRSARIREVLLKTEDVHE